MSKLQLDFLDLFQQTTPPAPSSDEGGGGSPDSPPMRNNEWTRQHLMDKRRTYALTFTQLCSYSSPTEAETMRINTYL